MEDIQHSNQTSREIYLFFVTNKKGSDKMGKYIVLLRGVNISGKNKISMPELKGKLSKNGYKNVFTYLNSGNVILESEETKEREISNNVSEIIKKEFDLDIPVFTIKVSDLKELLENSPTWWNTSDKNIYDNIIFVMPPLTYEEVYKALGEPDSNLEKVKEYKNNIFWSYDLKNYRKSIWWVKTASTSIKDSITIRTANTMTKLLNISLDNNWKLKKLDLF